MDRDFTFSSNHSKLKCQATELIIAIRSPNQRKTNNFFISCGHFSLEKSILFKLRREAIRNSYSLSSDRVWEQSEQAVMEQTVPKPCVHCLEKEPGQG